MMQEVSYITSCSCFMLGAYRKPRLTLQECMCCVLEIVSIAC
jgi:hypothetical protein